MDWLITILYGFFTGLGQLLPVSVSAHDYYLGLMTRFDLDQPLLKLWIHMATFGAVLLFYRRRAAHILREIRIKGSRRQSDMGALLDGQVVYNMFLPAAVGLLVTGFIQRRFESLPVMVALLTLGGVVLYVPHFLASGNRDSNHLSRLEALIFGLCSALSAIPGISRIGGILSVGALRGCSRGYLLDMIMLMLLPLMLLQICLDVFAVLAAGFGALTILYLLQCVMAGAAAFGGAFLAIRLMRVICANRNFGMFAFYCWGVSLFTFILYLTI